MVVKRILRYLSGTINFGLILLPSNAMHKFSLRAYNNNDWASEMDDIRSTSGSCIFFGPNLVSWSSNKQSLMSKSSVEAEYLALEHTTLEIYGLNLSSLNFLFLSFPLSYCVTTWALSISLTTQFFTHPQNMLNWTFIS